MIKFNPDQHLYTSVDTSDNTDWIGVTSLVSFFKPGFDAVAQSKKVSKNPRSKWFGIPPEEIQKIWNRESKRSLDAGTQYHNLTESLIRSSGSFEHNGNKFKVVEPSFKGPEKIASDQALLEDHVYPEHLVYLRTHGVCGQVDRLEVKDSRVNMRDYKTFKVMKTSGFTNWEGIPAKMKDPISHLEDCNFVHCSLQLSLYLYIVLKHNPFLSPGVLTIDHIIFEQESEDQYGYPINKKDDNRNFIVQRIDQYPVRFLRNEVIQILDFLKHNRELIKPKDGKDNTASDRI